MFENKMNKRGDMIKSKGGQVTIFIIIGLVIIFGLLLIIILGGFNIIPTASGGKLNVEVCIEDALNTAVTNLGMTAGFAKVEDSLSYNDKGDKIPYICYTNKYYLPCENQKPFLIQHFQEQLESKLASEVQACYDKGLSELKRKGYDVVAGKPVFNIALVPDSIVINLDAPTSISSQTGGTTRVSSFKFRTNSPLYNILIIATTIIQGETRDGDVNTDALMVASGNYNILKDKKSEGTTIYSIEDINTATKFRFASRSYAFPAGYGISEGVYAPGYGVKTVGVTNA